MRVLLDANIFISDLLNPQSGSPIADIIDAGILGRFVLLLPDPLLDEFVSRIQTKLYLRERIRPHELSRFVELLQRVGEVIPTIEQQIPTVTRDLKDDYLLAYAVVGEADYLVTGDADLLMLNEVAGITICNLRAFVDHVLHR